MRTWLNVGTAIEAHNARTADEYLQRQQEFLLMQLTRSSGRVGFSIHTATQAPRRGPLIEQGRWKIACGECDNWPSYHPDWQMACCFECGAVYQNLEPVGVVPDGATLIADDSGQTLNVDVELQAQPNDGLPLVQDANNPTTAAVAATLVTGDIALVESAMLAIDRMDQRNWNL